MESEVRRRSIRIKMSKSAGYLAQAPGCVADGRLRCGLDRVVKRFKAFPGDRGLKRIGDDASPDQALSRIRHPDKRVPPDSCRPFAMGVRLSRIFGRAAMIGAAFQGP